MSLNPHTGWKFLAIKQQNWCINKKVITKPKIQNSGHFFCFHGNRYRLEILSLKVFLMVRKRWGLIKTFLTFILFFCISEHFSWFSQLHICSTWHAYNFLIFYPISMLHSLKPVSWLGLQWNREKFCFLCLLALSHVDCVKTSQISYVFILSNLYAE